MHNSEREVIEETPWVAGGQFSAKVGPIADTGQYTVLVEAQDLWNAVASAEEPLGIKGLDYYLWRAAPPIVILLGTAIMLLLFPAISRAFLSAVSGYMWRVEILGPDHAVTVTAIPQGVFRIQWLGGDSVVPPPEEIDMKAEWNREDPALVRVRAYVDGDNVHVYVARAGFGRPWAQAIGGPWSDGERAVVAGQLTVGKPPRRRPLGATIRFAALGCREPVGTTRKLYGVRGEVEETSQEFRRVGATIISGEPRWPESATVADLKLALKTAHIVHLTTHALPDRICMARDGEHGKCIFTLGDLREIEHDDLYCRLLVLSACELAKYRDNGAALAYEFVTRGVNVLAATHDIDDVFGFNFFPHLYRELLPFRGWRGSTLAKSIRKAASEWERFLEQPEQRGTKARLTPDPVNGFILFGNPSFRLVYTLKETDMSAHEVAREWTLSAFTARSIGKSMNWNRIVALRGAVRSVPRGDVVDSPEADGDIDDDTRARVMAAFEGVKAEFKDALKPLSRQVNLFNWLFLPLSGLAMAVGAWLTTLSAISQLQIGGVVLSAGFCALFGCVYRGRNLGKDQAFLQLMPVLYESQLRLARTKKQYDFVFDAFVEETMALRRDPAPRGKGSATN